ncbi:hypothetical protein GS896_25315 [Rhodococcus hoagii]|nr:hypothetical protein [Prescottella equi]MBM4654176.1 hypothetical protein [Prescottella equi]MBM4719648.1 hypothetical protein [Prescottella equi]NKR23447.1 hypothetical protein [Prescottella equi]NKT55941.1 hypothetical protein [Prescottella equi]
MEVDEPASEMAEPTPTPPPAEPLSPVALKELSRALGGVSVDQLQQALAQNPQLLAGGPAETATAPTVHPTSAPEADAPTVSPAPNDKTLANADLATQGWRAWLVKLGIPMRKGATERFADMMEMVNAVIRRDLGRPIVVGVSSYRGGSGKTSAAVLMARLLAEIRGESVIVLDTDLFGTLVTRSVGDDQDARGGSVTMASLAAALRTSGGDVTRMVRDGGNGYVFVPGSTTFRANEIDPDGYRMIIEAVRQVYPIVLVDMAVVDDAPLYHAVLESLDGLVMMSPTVTGGVGFLYRTQTELQHRGVDHLNDHRISALNNLAAGRSEVDIADFARGLKVRDQRDVVEIPYDRHLAESTMIDMAKLSASTKTAFTLTLAALIDTFDGQKTN